MANKVNVVQLKSDLQAILGQTAADLGVALSETATAYMEQLARLSAACIAARAAGQAALADELALALEAQAKDVQSIVTDQVTSEFERTWKAILGVAIKVAIVAIKSA